MDNYKRGLRVVTRIGAEETVGTMTELRRRAKDVAMRSTSKYVGVAFGNQGQEMSVSDSRDEITEWYAKVSDRKDVYYAAWYDGRELEEEYVGEIQLTAKKKPVWPYLVGTAVVVGGIAVAGRGKK